MPSKHSRNNNTRGFFSSAEKQKTGHGTQKVRLGADSLRPFDYCSLCVQAVKDPVVCPSGFLFCRECIYKSLLAQRGRLEQEKAAYAKQCAAHARDAAAKASEEQDKAVAAFAADEGGVSGAKAAFAMEKGGGAGAGVGAGAGAGAGADAGGASGSADPSKADAMAALKTKVVLGVRDKRRAELKRTSFWLPEHTPDAAPADIPKPDPCPRCPESGKLLRMKQLVTVNFSRMDDDGAGGSGAGSGAGAGAGADPSDSGVIVDRGPPKYHCPACLKQFKYQAASLLKRCGHVFCGSCTKKFVVPAKRCFTCNKKVKPEKDIIAMQQGGSSFAAHNSVEAKVYRPTMT